MNKRSIVFLSYISIVLAAAVYSCGSDTASNSVPSGTQLFYRDSISVWLPASTYAAGVDSFYTTLSGYSGNFTLYYTLQSNADSVHAIGRYGLYTNATPATPYTPWIYYPVDVKDSINFSFVNGTYLSMAAALTVNNSVVPHYMRVKEIRVVKK